jgi:hypothetical protein
MIRKDLARKKFQENVAKIKSVLEDYRSKWVNAQGDEKKPTPPDFAALAKEYGMTAGVTGSVSEPELQDTDFGKSTVDNAESRRSLGVSGEIFGPKKLYNVGFSRYRSLSKTVAYIFWKTDDQDGGVPKWDRETQDKVREEWKLVRARKLALDAAEKLRDEISKSKESGKPFKDLVDPKQGIVVMQPPKFSWLTSLLGEQPKISKVGDLQNPGQDFMKNVFALGPGQMTIAKNLPQTEVYVVRMKELTPFKDLWEDFTSPDIPQDYLRLLIATQQAEVDPAWHKKVMRDAGYADHREAVNKAAERQPAPRSDGQEGAPTPEEM